VGFPENFAIMTLPVYGDVDLKIDIAVSFRNYDGRLVTVM
jgi:hypothetical protein